MNLQETKLTTEVGSIRELNLYLLHGWVLILAGALVVLASMALPVWRTRKVDEVDLTDGQHHRLSTH